MKINNLFASRDSLEEAVEYALSVVSTLQAADRAPVLTAIHVLSNTAIKLLEGPHHVLHKLLPSWDKAEPEKIEGLPPAEALQYLRNLAAPFLLAAKELDKTNFLGASIILEAGVMLAVASGLDQKAMKEEIDAFIKHQRDELLSSPDKLVGLLIELRKVREGKG